MLLRKRRLHREALSSLPGKEHPPLDLLPDGGMYDPLDLFSKRRIPVDPLRKLPFIDSLSGCRPDIRKETEQSMKNRISPPIKVSCDLIRAEAAYGEVPLQDREHRGFSAPDAPDHGDQHPPSSPGPALSKYPAFCSFSHCRALSRPSSENEKRSLFFRLSSVCSKA